MIVAGLWPPASGPPPRPMFLSARPLQLLVSSQGRLLRLVFFGPFRSSSHQICSPPCNCKVKAKAPLLTAIIVLPTLILGAAPPCGSTTTGATYPELGLAGSDSLCRSKAPPPLLATFTYEETPPYCIATISIWSPDPSTIPISNRCPNRVPSLTISFLAGLDNAVFASDIEPTLCQRQGLIGDKLFRRESGCPDCLSASGSGLMDHNHTNSKQAGNCVDSLFSKQPFIIFGRKGIQGYIQASQDLGLSIGWVPTGVVQSRLCWGVEAQTLANVYLALENNLEIVHVVNKIDLPGTEPEPKASSQGD
ncbi:hypothetical protein F2Q70_00032051 [Brassica cretica]|uniref:Uncharacterized protein n=1 Tax=Brassica cretica TaxID=69181 RepID=A0A8S9FM71_BRACR|nr:hypothetical protein F2Q70_00032051 [Brassica cretica]